MLATAVQTLTETTPTVRGIATDILRLILQNRRLPSDHTSCAGARCPQCLDQHLAQVMKAVQQKKPVTLILPAFPGKSPNPSKVLGPRADMAEQQSLTFLASLCQQIEEIYSPGARLILCSDGRVFNDVVGILEHDITTYQSDITALLLGLKTSHLSTFNLDDAFGHFGFDEMRAQLMSQFGEPMDELKAMVSSDANALRMYCGITRFLVEDSERPGMSLSRTALQKECKRRAYEVIRRSRAWDRLLATHFPEAIRLSIHPQSCGSRKIGIHLMETQDEWLTAWHSVAVEVGGRYRLMKRRQVEELGGELVFLNGRPSHFRLGKVRVEPIR